MMTGKSDVVRINGITLPKERFSTGASAGTGVPSTSLLAASVYGQQEMPLPKSVRIRTDLIPVAPGYASRNGLNLDRFPSMTESERQHHAMLSKMHESKGHLALLHNARGTVLAERPTMFPRQ